MIASQFSQALLSGVQEVRKSWGWVLTLGILLIVVGTLCLIGDVTATFATIFAFGWILIVGAVIALVHAFRVGTWHGFALNFLSALLRGFAGFALLRFPVAGAVAVTLVLSAFFIVAGLFRAVGASMMRFPQWGWAAFSGIVSLILGVLLITQLPTSSLWFIGFAIGIDMILEGASLVGFATALRRLPPEAAVPSYYKAA